LPLSSSSSSTPRLRHGGGCTYERGVAAYEEAYEEPHPLPAIQTHSSG
jgi:hypothetical protein